MCERRGTAAWAIAVALLLAQPARAQETDAAREAAPPIERLRLRADSLERAIALAEARVQALRPAAHVDERVALDTQRVGPIRVVSDRRQSGRAREIVTSALSELGDLPASAVRSLDSTYLLVAIGGGTAFDENRADERSVQVSLPRWMPRSRQAWRVAQAIGVALGRALPEDLRTWSGFGGVPLNSDAMYRETYRSLALSTSPAARDCLDGDVARCLDALSLTAPGASWERWYDEATLVAWARTEAQRQYTTGELAHACEAGRTLAACRALIDRRGGPPPPLPAIARVSLLAFVVEERGTSAWDVLVTDTTGALADRLAAAAGTDAAALIGAWRARVVAERPARFGELGGSSAATLFWVAILAALASRSTRWRLG